MTTTHIEVTPDTTPEELREAITNLSHTAHRYGRHDRRQDAWHASINQLLDALDQLIGALETQ